MKIRQWIISGILTAIILVGGSFMYQNFAKQKASTISEGAIKEVLRPVQTKKFKPKTIKNKIQIDGRLNAYEKINIAAEATGRLIDINNNLKDGSYFSKGDLLFQIESTDERYSLHAQRSSLLNSITQIMPNLKFDYPDAFQRWKNYLDAFDVERAVKPLPKVLTEQEKYFIAGKNIYNQYYTIKAQEERLKNFSVYAPFNGVLLSLNAYPGSLVNQGASLAQAMNTSKYELVAPLAMDQIKYTQIGQSVKLYSEELERNYTGTVTRVSKQIDQNTQSIPLYISVYGKGLRDGMYLKGNLNAGGINSAIAIPRSAMVDQNSIYTLQDSIVKKKIIEVIGRDENFVFARGIEEDDEVITSGTNTLFDGQKVIAKN